MLRSHLEPGRRETVSEFPKSVEPSEASAKIKVKVRFDYRGSPRPARFFIGGKASKEVAEELRQQQAALWRNVPLQGVRIDNIEFISLYSVYDEDEDAVITYAPMEMAITIDSLEECLRFVYRDEFRRVEFIEPGQLSLSNLDLERLFYKMGEIYQQKVKNQDQK